VVNRFLPAALQFFLGRDFVSTQFGNLLSAANFAAEKHRGQRRKDRDASPYINHPIAVATLLAVAGNVSDEALLIAALLHDTIEDTDTSAEEIEAAFGGDVLQLVKEVTDDKSLPKRRRKELQIEHAPHISARGKQLKIADKICNIRDMNLESPADWDVVRKAEYLDWAERVVAGCRGISDRLDQLFDQELADARARIATGI